MRNAKFCPGTDTIWGTDIGRQIYVRFRLPILARVRVKPRIPLTLGAVGRVDFQPWQMTALTSFSRWLIDT